MSVTWRRFEPSAFITQMSSFSLRNPPSSCVRTKASVWPSGENSACCSYGVLSVRLTLFAPLGSTVKMSPWRVQAILPLTTADAPGAMPRITIKLAAMAPAGRFTGKTLCDDRGVNEDQPLFGQHHVERYRA